ncbi:hypothetical protein LTR56_003192 [Elasticomyces elasticus]|nr:hypothetical protein LTR22_010725 [Elasticomyces elasticus]KAK3656060.1 hypothetical protein LTR56_003192 [Elasticomyces elasticus]KAK4920878.1 hypothetical protein LTR49_011600 [Elasticomyces elasticus]KAK5759606.1 hypothetical protein LTS12_010299 [Elasticomyces elasticus]
MRNAKIGIEARRSLEMTWMSAGVSFRALHTSITDFHLDHLSYFQSMASPKRVLIAGAGIAGPSLALLLSHNGHKVTIVERAQDIRTTGQQVDVAGKGVNVTRAMGVWESLLAHTVGDQGIKFIDEKNNTWAAFAADKESGAQSFVKEVEILRGDMAKVLYDATKNETEYIFGNTITAIDEHASHVTVTFSELSQRDFDLVIAADGLFSKTREIAFGKSVTELRSLNQCTALMTIPWKESDGSWSTWCNFPGGRCVALRPQPNYGRTGAYLAVMTPDSGRIARMRTDEQKAEFTRRFQDVGGEAPRILREMQDNDSVYVQETAQVYPASWHKGRVALLGDAAYCPSPVSGQGTTAAFIGSYILAGCICTHDDVQEALIRYEEQMRPFATQAQKLFPGVPGIANPQTAWGITFFYTILWIGNLVMKSGVVGLAGKLFAPLASLWPGSEELKLPLYPAMKTIKGIAP